MSMPIIGISANERTEPLDATTPSMSYALNGFVEAVQKAGGTPLILPIGTEEQAKQYVTMIDKLILTGGQHVLPQFYKEEKTIISDDYNLRRDLFELALIREALQQKKPIFSVCRGTQLFNVALGGTLYQDIEHHWQEEAADVTSHQIVVAENSTLADIFGNHAHINSYHHQAIKDLAPGLEVLAYAADDQIIEAITTTTDQPYLGVQWHPELLFQTAEENLKLFEYVVQKL